MNGEEIFKNLIKNGYLHRYEWQNLDDFSKFLAIMQNAKWSKTQKSLQNLAGINSLEKLAEINLDLLASLIKPSGFYNTKAKQLNSLAIAILDEFGDFENFLKNASFDWLISIKNIGFDTASSLLNHLCKKPFFVINANAKKLLKELDFEVQNYEEACEILSTGLDNEYFYNLLNTTELAEIYSVFNATIDNFISNKKTKN